MLLVSGKLKLRPYLAIWCEHHEDYLAERDDKKFDAYQIKTSRPESGAWKLNDLGLIKTIGRFVELVDEFGDAIEHLLFVSNTECEIIGPDNKNDRLRAQCPRLFLEHVRSCKAPDNINEVFKPTFLNLQAECGCSGELLLRVLNRMDIIPDHPVAKSMQPCRTSTSLNSTPASHSTQKSLTAFVTTSSASFTAHLPCK
ncbi:dsDNA nuclease domain-containing protein [Bradyrhizobium sp. McL0615]|uniref:dsDNA nuclease domain-containing protein n=1 Tax=Bradyrhizobium sp. McL0615 TaxID=3415673 RepID=UPI003CE76BBD